MIHASLCTGIGAAELAATWMGWKNEFSVEIDEFCNKVLKYHYPNSVHYGNIFEQDFREWRGRIDVLTAGFPCQPFSVAGARKGAEDDRYLWDEVFRAVNEIRPSWFVGENVRGITSMVLPGEELTVGCYTDVFGESYKETEMREQFVIDRICNDLEGINYSVQPIIIPACAVGAPHRRDRVWFIAENTERIRRGSEKSEKESKTGRLRKPCAGDNGRLREKQGSFANCADTRIEDLQREWKNRIHAIGDVANADQFNGDLSGFCSSEISQQQTSRILQDYTDASSERLQRKMSRDTIMPPESFRDFPTQSPVCNGNDGFPGELFGISFSKWRQESIKALGNSMVPQVVYEIFLAIEQVEKTFNKITI